MTAPSQTPEAAGLEPCPFCGGEAWLNDYEAKYSDLPPKSRAPQCRSCGASLGYLTTPAKATEAWNRRVTAASAQAAIDAEKAKVAELEAALEEARTIDAGFWKWLGERDLQPDGPDLEWGDIVVALTEHEDNAYDIADKANDRATAAEARADRLEKALEETRSRVREWPIDDHETCMCGSPVASHGMGDGHSPVSQGDHAISMIVDAIDAALQQETQK